jgi:hypothetical protein
MEVEVMATMYCQSCDRWIDLDHDVEHEDHCAEDQAAMWERSGVPKPEPDTDNPDEEK